MDSNLFPLMLYRVGSDFIWEGRSASSRIVANEGERKAAMADGWREAADFLAGPAAHKTLLDENAKTIEARLPDLDLAALEKLLADEKAGKTRKGVLAMIEAAIDARLA